jgi:Ca2+-binding EF-hand superfamily protein
MFPAFVMIPSTPPVLSLTDLQKRKLMKLFSMYDADNTGVLKLHNFQTLIDRLAALRNWHSDSSEYSRLTDKFMHRWLHIRAEVKDKLHRSKEGSITLEEWLLYYDQVLHDATYQDHIREVANLVFDAVDTDMSDHLDQEEWHHLFQVYGIPVIYAPESFAKIDTDQDNRLSRADVLQRIEEFYYSQDPDAPGNFMFGPL